MADASREDFAKSLAVDEYRKWLMPLGKTSQKVALICETQIPSFVVHSLMKAHWSMYFTYSRKHEG